MERRNFLLSGLLSLPCFLALGCGGSKEIELADPGKVEVPPPPKYAAGDPGAKPPKGGGSPPGDPSQYSK